MWVNLGNIQAPLRVSNPWSLHASRELSSPSPVWPLCWPQSHQHLNTFTSTGGWGGHLAPIRRGRVWGASTPCVDLDQPSLADQVTASVDLLDRLAATHQTCNNFQDTADWENSVLCLYLFFYYGFCERKINWTKDISGGHKGFGKLGTSLFLVLSIFFGG